MFWYAALWCRHPVRRAFSNGPIRRAENRNGHRIFTLESDGYFKTFELQIARPLFFRRRMHQPVTRGCRNGR